MIETIKGLLKRKENPRIIAIQSLQSHYEERMQGGLSLKNKIRRSVGLPLVEEAPLIIDQYQDITSTLSLTMDEIKQKESDG